MFAKFRRRSLLPCPSTSASGAEASAEAEAAFADDSVAERGERIRAALQGAGFDLEPLGPAPSWLAAVRTGARVPLGPEKRAELTAYLGTTTTSCLVSDEACARVVQQLEAFGLLQELREDGITVKCGAAQLSARQLRGIQEGVRAIRVDESAG